jgi:hypothetical protein
MEADSRAAGETIRYLDRMGFTYFVPVSLKDKDISRQVGHLLSSSLVACCPYVTQRIWDSEKSQIVFARNLYKGNINQFWDDVMTCIENNLDLKKLTD